MELCGGVATRATIVAATSRQEFEQALREQVITRLGHGVFRSAGAERDRSAAAALHGVISHLDAAMHWGWAVKHGSDRPHITIPPNRRLKPGQARGVHVHRAVLGPGDVVGQVTSRERTIVDCLRTLPADEALCVADSALRGGESSAWLRRVAAGVRGPGARQVREIAEQASPLAANPFESVMRHLAGGVAGLNVRPQMNLYGRRGWLGCPDLVDEELGIVFEADSFEWHGSRAALVKDARRYNAMAVEGWLVLRFTWEDVMLHPETVVATMEAAVFERSQWPRGLGRYA